MPWSSPSTRATLYDVLAANWNELVNDLLFLKEIGYAEVTAPVTSTATTVGTAVQIVTLGALTYENAPVMIEFFCPRAVAGAGGAGYVILRDGATVIGTLCDLGSGGPAAPIVVRRRLTPSAASHTYNIACWNAAAGTSTFSASSGGVAGDATTRLPLFMRAEYVPT